MPQIAEKYVAGYALDSAGDPIVGATVTAVLSDRIVRTADNLVVEKDAPVTAITDADGRWSMALHPNNVSGDAPQNTHWTITEPSQTAGPQIIFISASASGGATDQTALAYTSLIVQPTDLPAGGVSLQSQITANGAAITALSAKLDLALSADSDGLAALTPPAPTTLVDEADAASALATGTSAGLISATDYTLIQTFKAAQTNDPTTFARKDANGIILPSNTRPAVISAGSARDYVNATTGERETAVNISGTTSYSVLAPGFDSPSFQITTDFSVPNPTYTVFSTVNAGTPLSVAANALYFIQGSIAYTAQGQWAIGIRFSALPTGSTIRWGAIGLSSEPADSNFAARPTATPPASGGVGNIDAALRTGTNEMLLPGQGITNSLLTGQSQSPAGGVSVYIYGTLRTGANSGGMNFQARQNVLTSGATTNPLILAGSSISLTRVS